MRTAIFVYQPTTVTIQTLENQLELTQLNAATAVPLQATTTLEVDPGVYKIVSSQEVTVTAADASTIYVDSTITSNEKWPEPPNELPAGLSSASTSSIQTFFATPDAK